MGRTVPASSEKVESRFVSLREFRIIPRIETYPSLVEFTKTIPGKAALLALFGFIFRTFVTNLGVEIEILLGIAITTFVPRTRHLVLAVAPLIYLSLQFHDQPTELIINLVILSLGILLYLIAMNRPDSPFGRRPVACSICGFSLLIVIACNIPRAYSVYSLAWNSVGILATYFWFICYAISDRNSPPRRDLALEAGALRPAWGSTNTPFPKGAAYLRRIEAKDDHQLAVCQLKGLKLLTWALVLGLLQGIWMKFFHEHLGFPSAVQALIMSANGTPVPWHVKWISQILFFFEITLQFAIVGNHFVAICRMFGFNALRNSYRPLSATTIAEFFNRFYYYFKELLVDLFFYPTFLRYWKGHRRLRMFFATFAAVVVGNSFYHLTRDWQFIRDLGLLKALAGYQVLFFYNVVLATAISISQLRKRKPKPKGFVRGHLLPSLGVLLFYCILSVFGDEDRQLPLYVHLKYLAGMFFIQF